MTTETNAKPVDPLAFEMARDARFEEAADRRQAVANAATDARMERHMREQTAATILAALTSEAGMDAWWTEGDVVMLPSGDCSRVRYAVALADALRAELAKGGG